MLRHTNVTTMFNAGVSLRDVPSAPPENWIWAPWFRLNLDGFVAISVSMVGEGLTGMVRRDR